MKKIQEAVYFKRIDLNDLCYPHDRRITGSISSEKFSTLLRSSRLTLSPAEISEIIFSAPKDLEGNISYKDFQRQLSKQELSRTFHKSEANAFTLEKIACAVKEFINEAPNLILNYEDLQKIIRKTWLDIPPDELRRAWQILPHDSISLEKWAQKYAVPIESFRVSGMQYRKEEHPRILSKLREVALTYGNKLLIQAFRTKPVLFRDEMVRLLEKFRVMNDRDEFNEFREWGINHEIVKRYGSELGFDTEAICQYFVATEMAEPEIFAKTSQVLDQVIENTVLNVVAEKFEALQKCLAVHSNRDYVEEIRLREVFKSTFPWVTNENISLIVNSLRLTLRPTREIPFRQIYVPELISLFENTQFTLPLPEKLTPAKPEPPTTLLKPVEVRSISESFFVKPRDYSWEKSVIGKIHELKKPLLANFLMNDFGSKGFLSLEAFHYVLKKSMEWMPDEEINFLVDLAIRECGSVDEERSEAAKKDLNAFRCNETISAAWFPEGDQYNIAYLYFLKIAEVLTQC